MRITLKKVGGGYKPVGKVPKALLPEKVAVEVPDDGGEPYVTRIWSAGIGHEVAARLLELSDELEIHGEKK